METSIIIVLAIILLALIILNNIKIDNSVVTTSNTTITTRKANCSQTTFGCCPNGVDSKIDYLGRNCPGYNPGPGYLPTPNPVIPPNPVPGPSPPPKKPIGGCAGTRYGCCPDNIKPKIDVNGSNCLVK
jgi:hypothetical protein